MDIDVLYELANETFQCRLEKDRWFALPEEVRKGALAVGELDVETRLGMHNSSDPRFIQAILEQSVFLALRPEENYKELVQETVTGLGSQKWQYNEEMKAEFAPRALRLIRAIENERYCNSISRG